MGRIYNNLCEDILPTLKNNSVDLIITSPPYNLNKEYEKKMCLVDWVEFQYNIISECVRVLKDSGSICWQVGNYVEKGEVYPLDLFIYDIFKEYNLKLRNRIIWTFNHGLHCKNRLSGRYETILWFTKTDDYIFNLDPIRIPQKYPNKKYYKGPNKGKLSCNPLGKNPSDVWEITNVKNNHPEKTEHPAQFPEELVKRLVLSLSDEGGLVLDPFGGSGTVGKVCGDNNRDFILIEKEDKYIKIIKERLNGFI